MKIAYLFPAGVEIKAGNIRKAQKLDISLDTTFLRQASKDGRLRCPCNWCLAPLQVSQRGGTLYFAHKPRTAAVCPHYWAQATELVESTMRLVDDLKAARAEAAAAKAELAKLRDKLMQPHPHTPILLLPLTQEMLDLRREVQEPRHVLFVIPESDLESIAPQLGLSIPPGLPGRMIPPAHPESEHVH